MGLFGKKKAQVSDKHCFRCGKEIKGDGYTKSHGRYCCENCCSRKGKSKEVCEFC